jgi:hypothetical protein
MDDASVETDALTVAKKGAQASEAIATVEPVASRQSPLKSTRNLACISLGRDAVAGAIECVGKRFASFGFLANVANESDEPLMCSIVGETRTGEGIFYPAFFWVSQRSVTSVSVMLNARIPWRINRLVMRMENTSLQCSAEAMVPVPGLIRALRFAFVTIGALAVLCAPAYVFGRPRVDALIVQPDVTAGTLARASYATAGWGTAAYVVSNGAQRIAGGTLSPGQHDLLFRTAAYPEQYSVALTVSGPLGTAIAKRSVRTIAPASASAAIDSFGVAPPVVKSGATFQARYVIRNGPGTVRLLDAAGFPLSSKTTDKSGVTKFLAPVVDVPTTLRVALEIQRGSSPPLLVSTGMVVTPQEPPTANAPGGAAADALFEVVPSYVRSGQAFTVRPLQHPDNFELVLQDERGLQIASQHVSPGTLAVTFVAPYTTRDQRYTVVASYARGAADDVALKSIIVHAK